MTINTATLPQQSCFEVLNPGPPAASDGFAQDLEYFEAQLQALLRKHQPRAGAKAQNPKS